MTSPSSLSSLEAINCLMRAIEIYTDMVRVACCSSYSVSHPVCAVLKKAGKLSLSRATEWGVCCSTHSTPHMLPLPP